MGADQSRVVGGRRGRHSPSDESRQWLRESTDEEDEEEEEEEEEETGTELFSGDVDEGGGGGGDRDGEGGEESFGLRREIGLVQGVALIMGTIIGSGIFMSPRGIQQGAGSVGMSLLVWVMCGIMSSLSALCYAELGAAIPRSGGVYAYILRIYGDFPGFLVSWAYILLIGPAGTALNALTFGTYVGDYVTPGDCGHPQIAIKLFSLLALMIGVYINCSSVKHSASAQVVFTTSKVLILVLISGCGLVNLMRGFTRHLDPSVAFQGTSTDVFGYGSALYQGLWAFSGWDVMNVMAEEVKNPGRNIPLALCISMAAILATYLCTNIAYFTMMSPTEVLASSAVAVTFAERSLGVMAWIIPLGVCISTFGNLLSGLLASPRNAYAAGREGHTVKMLSMISIKRYTPMPSVLFQGLFAAVLVCIGDFNSVLNYLSGTIWVFFAFSFLAIPILRYRYPHRHRTFKVPIVIPMLAFALCIFMVVMAIISDLNSLYFSVVLMGVGSLFYLVFVHWKYRPACMDAVEKFIQMLLLVTMSDDPKVKG